MIHPLSINRPQRIIPLLLAGLAFSLICGLVKAAAPNPLKVLDLATAGTPVREITRVYGSTGDGRAGTPVAGGHDCDGDGFADFAFASIQADPLGRNGAGEVILVFGDGTIGGTIDTQGLNARYLKIAGDQEFEVAGAEIWMDDVTGDGLGDLLICRQNYTPGMGRAGAGALTILVGGSAIRTHAQTETYLDLRNPPAGLTIATITGNFAYDRLGIWVRTGDIDGDGTADIAVGADQVDRAGAANEGAVYVIRGGAHLSGTQTIDLAQFGSTAIVGHVARLHPPANSGGFHLGATVQIADLDGNGKSEVLAAAALNRSGAGIQLPGTPAGQSQAAGGALRGKLYIAWDDNFPSIAWSPGYSFEIPNSPGSETTITGASFHRAFGEEILGNIDVDGDAKPDLLVSDLTATTSNGVFSGAGHLFYDAATLKGLTINLDAPPMGLEFSVILGPIQGAIGTDSVAAGDFNNDGYSDLVIGNPHDRPFGRSNAGSMHILLGQQQRWPATIDLGPGNFPTADMMRIIEVAGALGNSANDTGDVLCYSVAAADINMDGRDDIIVNEMAGNGLAPNSLDVGNLLVISATSLQIPAPRISSFELTGATKSDASITFPTVIGQTYRVQRRSTFPGSAWSDIGSDISGDGTDATVLSADDAMSPMFYYQVRTTP